MANFVNRDKKRRKLYLNTFKKRNNLKIILKDKDISLSEKYQAQLKLNKLDKNSSRTRLKKRCILTGQSRSVVSPFNISRIQLRDLLSHGLIPGVRKSSW
jgi:small subunit ribosomal protein S14